MRAAVLIWIACVVPLSVQARAALRATHLRCEYRINPLGIDVAHPRLSWVLEPEEPRARGLKQTAYRVLVASTRENLDAGKGDLWDTGKLTSDQSIHLVYNGKPLASGAEAFWKVQVWDQVGQQSPWSETAWWSMGLLMPADWKATWIGRDEDGLYKSPSSPYWSLAKARWIWRAEAASGAGLFRTSFTVPPSRTVKRAVIVMGADSRFELHLNGERIGMGTFVLMPQVFDIRPWVRAGENNVSVNASGGKTAGLIGAIRIHFSEGEPLLVVTNSSWKTAEGEGGAWRAARDLGPYGMEPWREVGFQEERALPARMLRKEFEVTKPVRRATVYVSGLGLYELYVNGTRIGDQVLAPNLTEYNKRVHYNTFDVTRQVTRGRNAIGAILGNGRWWAPRAMVPTFMRNFGYPRLLLQLEIEYTDGSRATVLTDPTWKLSTAGPIRANNEYDGEEYDARMEMPGWSKPGFDDSQWEQARGVISPIGAMVAQMAEPLRVVETLKPMKVTQPRPGVWVFDMGQNMVGWCKLKVAGPRGAQVGLRHAEILQPNGMLYVDNLRSARANDLYTLKGEGTEIWEPRFTYHGFRYVEVTGYPGERPQDAIEGRVVHDAMGKTADFVSSNELLNHIHKNIYWGVRGNYRSIPTDCPQRDERQGWLGDRSVVSRSESYLFDIAAFYTKWITDIADSQKPDGSVPVVAPAYWPFYNDDVTWPSTFILAPGMLYEQYGDTRVIEHNYPGMKKWIDHMRGYLNDDLMPRDRYGDWCVPPEKPELIHSKDPARQTDGALLGTAYFYQMLRLTARYARLIGRDRDIDEFESLAARMKTAFHKHFFNPSTGLYSNGTQTSSILPLAFGIPPEENRKTIFDGLIRRIETESHGHVGTGLVGAQWLMRTLSDFGRPDVAYTIATQRTYPGWGYMIEKGATTIWELWNGDTADPAMNSGNHVMQVGDLNVWFYEYLAGIRPDPEKPGFKHFSVRPYPAGDLTSVKASHRSMYGTIAVDWQKDGGRFRLNVTVPPNTTATVYVPAKSAASVTESGQPASQAKSVRFVRMEAGRAVYEVQSGAYSFEAGDTI